MEEKLFKVEDGSEKSISDLMQDIHTNHKKRQDSINEILVQIMMSIEDVTDLPVILPSVERLIGHQLKNDSHILKLTEIATKIVTAKESGEDMSSIWDDLANEMDNMRDEKNKLK